MMINANGRVVKSGSYLVPVDFLRIMLQWAAEKKLDMAELLVDFDSPSDLLTPVISHVPASLCYKVIQRIVALNKSLDGLGYEFGLRMGLKSHGLSRFALFSQLTLRDAIGFGVKFSPQVMPVYQGEFIEDNDRAYINISLMFTPEPEMRFFFMEMALTAVWNGIQELIGEAWPIGVELCFDYPEPSYFANYRHKLPLCRFNRECSQVSVPAQMLDRRLPAGDSVIAQLLAERISEPPPTDESTPQKSFIEQVRQELVSDGSGYPDMTTVSNRLCVSRRTLKRRLLLEGTSFQQLLDEVRCSEASRLLSTSAMSIDAISVLMGYSDPSNFTHAFRRWTGVTPSEYRLRFRGNGI